jgi:predicted transcriptional regulator
MAKYRDGLGIIADILHAAGNGAKKTHIMYLANLSYGLLEKYLWATVHSGFLHANSEGFEVTEKGEAFLEKYLALSSRSLKLENEVQSVMFEREILKRMCQPLRNDKPKMARGRKCQVKKAC